MISNRIYVNRRVLALLFFGLIAVLPSLRSIPRAMAANASITITPITAYNFIVDSNVLSPATYAPRAATIGAKFCNTGTETVNNLTVYVGDYTNDTTFTPGTYPTRNSSTFGVNDPPGFLNTGLYSLTHVAGTGTAVDDATRYVGSLAPGACTTQYWLVTYPNTNAAGTASAAGTVKPNDDLWLNYDLWALGTDTTGTVSNNLTRKATMRNEISASANKIWPNGDNKVPPQYKAAIDEVLGWALTPGSPSTAYPGQIVSTQGIWYDLGNVGAGFDNNGDGVPDRNAWMQPVGDPSFNTACFRLVRTYGLVIVKLVGGGEYLIPFVDQLYFENIPDNNGAVGLVYYEYAALDGTCTGALSPYQEVASGFDNEKFSGDYGTAVPPLQSIVPATRLDKQVNNAQGGSASSNDLLTYDLYFENNTDSDSGSGFVGVQLGSVLSLGAPFTVEDTIPTDTTFELNSMRLFRNANGVTTEIFTNDATYPYTKLYKVAGVWTATQPGAGSSVQAVRWVFSNPIAGAPAKPIANYVEWDARFQVRVNGTQSDPVIDNTGQTKIGSAVQDTDTATVLIGGAHSISGVVFEDDGTNTNYADGDYDGDAPDNDAQETGITATNAVSLYYQVGSNWVLVQTQSTPAGGAYSFTGLPNGNYQIRVNTANVTTGTWLGWAPTSPTTLTATISGASVSGRNFGFVNPLSLTKTRTSTSPAAQGSIVSFTINASSMVSTCTYDVWANSRRATLGTAAADWTPTTLTTFPFNGTPAGIAANQLTSSWNGNRDAVAALNFAAGSHTGAITKVEALYHGYLTADYAGEDLNDSMYVEIYRDTAATPTYGTLTYSNELTGGAADGQLQLIDNGVGNMNTMILADVTSAAAWTHTDFNDTNNVVIQAVTHKDQNQPAADTVVRGLGFRVTYACAGGGAGGMDVTTVPLVDTYNSNELQFVSASVNPSSVTAVGANSKITWNNIGPLTPGLTTTITVYFRALLINTATISTNFADIVNPLYSDGRAASAPPQASDTVAFGTTGSLQNQSISGIVWEERNNNTTYTSGTDVGISGVSVWLDTGIIGTFEAGTDLVQVTGTNGAYSFTNIPTNANYHVRVFTSTLPTLSPGPWTQIGELANNVADSINNDVLVNLSTNQNIGNNNFGFSKPIQAPTGGTIGDYIFWDINGNGDLDWSDPGIGNIPVTLYNDVNGDGLYTAAADGSTALATTYTSNAAATRGQYQFTGLITSSAGTKYVVVIGTPPGTISSDPDADGVYCQTIDTTEQSYLPNYASNPALDECNNQTNATLSTTNPTFMGADFGYTPVQAIGDRVWLDTDGDGVEDPGEMGIPGVTVQITGGPDGTVTLTTDADGYWYYVPSTTGNYTFNVSLPNAGTQLSGYTQTKDLQGICPNGGSNPCDTSVSRSVAANEVFMGFDFGFTNLPLGTLSLSGAICPDASGATGDGLCDDGETGYGNRTVYLYIYNGPNNYTYVGSTTTASGTGAYSFSGLANGTTYAVTTSRIVPPLDTMQMNVPLSANLPAGSGTRVYDQSLTDTTSEIRVTMNGNNQTQVDFAYYQAVSLDYGDLPLSYNVASGQITAGNGITAYYQTLESTNPTGPRHIVPTSGTMMRLGASIDADPTAPTQGDVANGLAAWDGADDNGVVFNSISTWTDSSVRFTVTTSGSNLPAGTAGWLMGWIDFDQNGRFDADEIVADQQVTIGQALPQFNIDPPNGTFSGTSTKDLYARFRLFPSNPGFAAFAYSGYATGGEVEDYFVENAGVVPVTLSYFKATRTGNATHFDWSTVLEIANAGFNLYAQTASGLEQINDDIILSKVIDSTEETDYRYVATGIDSQIFYIEDVDLYGNREMHGPFELGEETGARLQDQPVDWNAIQAEHQSKHAEQTNASISRASQRSAQARAALTSNPNINPETLGYPVQDIYVDRTGMYRITYEQLVAVGLDLRGVHANNITISNRGVNQPIIVEPNGKFGPGSYIEFYGQALDTLYTDTNVYQLRIDPRGATRPNVESQAAKKKDLVVGTYMETVSINRNLAYGYSSPFSDPWYDTDLSANANKPNAWSYTLNVDHYALGAGPVTLVVNLYGLGDQKINPDHHILVSLNGQVLADEKFDGPTPHPMTINVPANVLKEGANILTLRLPADLGVSDFMRFDSAKITYPRTFWAQNGALTFTASGAAFQVDNLPSANVTVMRLDANSTTIIKPEVSSVNGSFRATFKGSGVESKYLVFANEGKLTPVITPHPEATDITSGMVDFVIISHPDFIDGLAPLVAVRQAQGLTVRVVNVNDVYAQFNYGIFDPQPIKDYIAYAKQNMGTRYVLLVGGDTFDYRQYLNANAYSFMPSFYRQTSEIITFAPVDPLYADITGDNVPDVALGRFPVRNNAELATVVNKTLTYTANSYQNTAVFTADQTFGSTSDAQASLMPSNWTIQKYYLDKLAANTARAKLIAAINQGAALTVYNGHSSYDRWTYSGLFTISNLTQLTNAGRPTIVLQWGCWNTYYVRSNNQSLGTQFLTIGDKGAAAVMGATALTEASSEAALARHLMPLITQQGMTIGDAVLQAKQQLANETPHLLDVQIGWTLLGDPTLTVAP